MAGAMTEATAAILVIGDEILSGKTEESNARFLIHELRELGVALRMIMVVPDDVEQIAKALVTLSSEYTYVFTSGGVGPTHDDVTLSGVSRAFSVPIVRHSELERLIRSYLGDKVQEAHLLMANVPEGSRLITGDGLKWPVLVYHNVYILPGVPRFFREKFMAIREQFRAQSFYLRFIYTLEDEFAIAGHLQSVAERYRGVSIGSYPSFEQESDYKVKITIESRDQSGVEQAFSELFSLLRAEMIVRCQ